MYAFCLPSILATALNKIFATLNFACLCPPGEPVNTPVCLRCPATFVLRLHHAAGNAPMSGPYTMSILIPAPKSPAASHVTAHEAAAAFHMSPPARTSPPPPAPRE
eukprot:CAMPEP_0119340292 /NCGR_PEP_ID=MMETSP1333-20130426/100037_1 /TAXON_ID=418940 /ORGANISM="Scyphosphaera apsteinii, Strain RCC1455" /LENGTH=105 /DNA_ID=CAMNT_0007352013 /DNA_START=378 /DNA_END=695 /DNA_ORIENTATION=+